MPATEVTFYAEGATSPFLNWVDAQQPTVQDKIFDAVARLEELGHELRRPEADYLRDHVYELRVKKGHVNYRALYFFDDVRDVKGGRVVRRRAVIVHGCTKERAVAARDINIALARRTRYLSDRAEHSYVPPAP